MPYICLIRTDMDDAISQGTFYVGDLLPEAGKPMPKLGADANKVDRSTAQGPYIPVAANAGDTVATEDPGDGSVVTSADYSGLSAFLLDNCVDGGDGGAISAADANTLAGLIVTSFRSGGAMTSTALGVLIAAGDDAAITVAASGGDDFVDGVLKVLAGYTYKVDAGSEIAAADASSSAAAGSFDSDSSRVASQVTSSLSLTKSLASGQLAGFCDASFSYGGTSGAALVVYDDDGSVL